VTFLGPRPSAKDATLVTKDIAPREAPRSQASAALPSPAASVEAPSAVASVEAPSVPAPSPPASVEAHLPAEPIAAPTPAPDEKKAPTPVETQPSETVAARKPSGPSLAAEPKAAPAERQPETDLSGLQPAKPTKAESRADDGELQQALAEAASRAKGCRDSASPISGVASVSVTIAPSGDVTGAVVQNSPFAHTLEGACVAGKFRSIHISPFKGDTITVRKSVSLQ
jgi:outer membrane biosynthesis protein TonB